MVHFRFKSALEINLSEQERNERVDQLNFPLVPILFSQPAWTSNSHVRKEKPVSKDHPTREQVTVWWVNKHSLLFYVSGVETASPAADWDLYTLDLHYRESPRSLGCWCLMPGSQDTSVAWIPQECVSKRGQARMIRKHISNTDMCQVNNSHRPWNHVTVRRILWPPCEISDNKCIVKARGREPGFCWLKW